MFEEVNAESEDKDEQKEDAGSSGGLRSGKVEERTEWLVVEC